MDEAKDTELGQVLRASAVAVGVGCVAVLWLLGPALAVLAIGLSVVAMLYSGVYLVSSNEAVVVEKWGRYHCTLQPGVHFLLPVVYRSKRAIWACQTERADGFVGTERFSDYKLDLRMQTLDFPPQTVMTKEGVPLKLNGSLYYTIVDAHHALSKVANLYGKMVEDAQICLRNYFASINVEQARDFSSVCVVVSAELAERLKSYGLQVNNVEIQDIDYPAHVKKEIQMRTEQKQKQLTQMKQMDDQMERERKQMEVQHIVSEREMAAAEARSRLVQRETQIEADRLQLQHEARLARELQTADNSIKLAQLTLEEGRIQAKSEAERAKLRLEADLPGINDAPEEIKWQQIQQRAFLDSYRQVYSKFAENPNTTLTFLPADGAGISGMAATMKSILKSPSKISGAVTVAKPAGTEDQKVVFDTDSFTKL